VPVSALVSEAPTGVGAHTRATVAAPLATAAASTISGAVWIATGTRGSETACPANPHFNSVHGLLADRPGGVGCRGNCNG